MTIHLPGDRWLSWRPTRRGLSFGLRRPAGCWSTLRVSWVEALAVAVVGGLVVGAVGRFVVEALG